MRTHYDALIIGAGIVGAACASELAQAGLHVAVVEQEIVGGGTTAAGMGHIVVMDGSLPELVLTSYSQQLWAELLAERPADHEHLACGTLWVAADAEELAEAQAKQARYSAHGIASRLVAAAELYALEPLLRPGLAGGLLVPSDSVIYPPRSAALLIERARNHGAQVISAAVCALRPSGVLLADGQTLTAEAVILAGGIRSQALAPELPLRAKQGHLAITERYPHIIRQQLVELGYIKSAHASSGDSVAFNVQPRPTGQLLIGSSRQFDRSERSVDQAMLAQMLRRAVEYMPALAQLTVIRAWTGLRPATPDGLPLIGPAWQRPGVWLATGHEGLGITTALGTAKLLAAQLLGHSAPIPAAPYLPARFDKETAHG